MRLKQLALMRQEKLFGAHEIQRFNRDADETVAWISEKDVVLSSDDYGRDLASVQTLQVEFSVFYIFATCYSEYLCGIKSDTIFHFSDYSVNMMV